MTILVAYAPRPEGRAALDKGIEIAKRRQMRLLVVNASAGGGEEDGSFADASEADRVEKLLAESGVGADLVDAIEHLLLPAGREDDVPVVVKFYRPKRWSTAAILEEHAFALELAAAEVPVVAPDARIGITAGASTPQRLVDGVLERLRDWGLSATNHVAVPHPRFRIDWLANRTQETQRRQVIALWMHCLVVTRCLDQ